MNPHSRSASHLPGLDLLRAVAITFVLLFHYAGYFHHPAEMETWISFGWTGVDLFFVLSGYLITSQLLQERRTTGSINIPRYFIKRSCRILPSYWAVLAVYFLIPAGHEVEGLAPFYKYITFTQNLGLDVVHNRTFSHAWSLCIEEQFYLLLPLLLLAVRKVQTLRKTLVVIVGLVAAGVLVRWLSWEAFVTPGHGFGWPPGWGKWIYYPTQCRLDGLLVGVGIATTFHYRSDLRLKLSSRVWPCLTLGLLGLSVAWLVASPNHSFRSTLAGFPLVSLSYGLILIAVTSPSFQMDAVLSFPIRWLATLSYAIYLSHKMVIHLVQPVFESLGLQAGGVALLAACLSCCIAVAILMHLLIEKPAFWLRDRWLSRA